MGDGALGRIRTCDQLLRRQPLYPLSYERWCGRRLPVHGRPLIGWSGDVAARVSPTSFPNVHVTSTTILPVLVCADDAQIILNVVIVAGAQSRPGLERARRVVERVFFAGGRHVLSRDLLVCGEWGWEVLAPAARQAPPSPRHPAESQRLQPAQPHPAPLH